MSLNLTVVRFGGRESPGPPGPWSDLQPPVFPEGDYDSVAVYCQKCGRKNRLDEGWRYRDDPVRRAEETAYMSSFGLTPLFLSLYMNSNNPVGWPHQRWPRLAYECGQCRDDRPATVEVAAEDEKKDEVQPPPPQQDRERDAVALRTRSRGTKRQRRTAASSSTATNSIARRTRSRGKKRRSTTATSSSAAVDGDVD